MYRYDNYTDSFVRIDGEPNTGSTTIRVGVPLKEAVTIKKVELTDECIDKIADAVVRKLSDRKTEPQTYVINPQETTNDDKCFECDDFFTCGGQCDEVEDEPQTERSEYHRSKKVCTLELFDDDGVYIEPL